MAITVELEEELHTMSCIAKNVAKRSHRTRFHRPGLPLSDVFAGILSDHEDVVD